MLLQKVPQFLKQIIQFTTSKVTLTLTLNLIILLISVLTVQLYTIKFSGKSFGSPEGFIL